MQPQRGRLLRSATGLRDCGDANSPAQRTSPDRSLAGAINRRILYRHSPRRHRTGKMRTKLPFISSPELLPTIRVDANVRAENVILLSQMCCLAFSRLRTLTRRTRIQYLHHSLLGVAPLFNIPIWKKSLRAQEVSWVCSMFPHVLSCLGVL